MFQWKDAKSEALMDSKLKCVFELPAAEQVVVAATAKEDASSNEVRLNLPDLISYLLRIA